MTGRCPGTRLVMLMVGLLSACGYGFPGRPAHIPADAETIRIEPFVNNTREMGLELALARALESVIRERGVLRPVAREEADLLLTGNLRDLITRAVGFSQVDQAEQYETTVILDATLQRPNGKVLWRGTTLVETVDAGVTRGVVIESSPRFQQGNLNAEDLRGLTDIQVAEDRRGVQVVELMDAMARSIYSQMMEGF